MIRQEEIAVVIDSQKESLLRQEPGLSRDALSGIPVADSFATIITGMRRCGKSTIIMQLLRQNHQDAIYLNFDDIRLSGFDTNDFPRLHREIETRAIKTLFFDEIQIVVGWEKYINLLLRESYKVFITGSNASMLSMELGTFLTGRHLSMELFPFSYNEYLRFKGLDSGESSVLAYLKTGGLPEYVRSEIPLILNNLADDILMRDIAVRHSIRDVTSLRQLAAYLINNIGNLVSANKLAGLFNVKSPATLLEYFSYLKDAYLFDFIPVYSHSLKVQTRNPRKVYVMDNGVYTENSLSTSENLGRRLENLIFLHLRRSYRHIFYYKNIGECDFITLEKNSLKEAVQVCLTINQDNFNREYNGLTEAMQILGIRNGYLVTLNQQDIFEEKGMTIKMIPAFEFLSGRDD